MRMIDGMWMHIWVIQRTMRIYFVHTNDDDNDDDLSIVAFSSLGT